MTHPAQNQTEISLDPPKASEALPETSQPPPTVPEAERLFGGQFKTVEELEAAYASLNVSKEPEKASTKGPAIIAETPSDEEVSDALTKAGLNLDDFAEEFNTSGELSQDSYAKLQQAGYPKELVDVYVDGLRARVQSYEASVYAPVGGKAEYEALLQWASTHVNAEYKQVFNDAVQSGDSNRAAMAVQALIALRGGNNRLLNGKTSVPNSGIQPFESQEQVVAAMRDSRYSRDPAYRKQIESRLAVSPLFV